MVLRINLSMTKCLWMHKVMQIIYLERAGRHSSEGVWM